MVIQSLRKIWQCIRCKPYKTEPVIKFVDLAPTADVENADIYFEALEYATNNDRVLNIALTGPYGSGKSSIIKSFLLRYPREALQLSLASFLPVGEVPGLRVSKQEIERSILQQIFYGVDANKLPFSRFKRIQVPKRLSIANSLFITIGVTSSWYLFSKQADLISGTFFKPLELSNWINYLSAGIATLFVWKVIHSVYTTSFGLSLKSLSLKDVQIAPAAANEESILNRHLDEILYFFQTTDCDLVVIEDLDRFENSDIFVTLREINGLINANEGIKRRVRFLYALRDDIFANTDRTKFFEFIVPVIPIINHSNSIDKVLEQGRRIDLETKLDRQFVREVSRYLTDLRLIRNIFNEYIVYAANVNADSEGALDLNKLLAILIYKNVLPKDFAALHRQEGVLSQVLGRYEQYITTIEKKIHDEISGIETSLQAGEAEVLRNESDLRKIYAMEIIGYIPNNYHTLRTPTGSINLGSLPESEALEGIITQKSVSIDGQYVHPKTIHFADLETKLDPTRTFEQRKLDISKKSVKFKQSSESRLRTLKAQLSSLRTKRFNEVIRESSDLIDQVFSEIDDNRELLKYLILEGYLDDTYYQYISLFHSGRLSPNDNNFLIQIRGYNNPPPDFPIDNAGEVIASMRVEDFGHNYVLNRFVIDQLFSHAQTHSQRIADAVDYIAANFQSCGDFFRSYYSKGAEVEALIQNLIAKWPNFVPTALTGVDSALHAARIMAYAPDPLLKHSANAGALKSFLSSNTRQILDEKIDFDFDRLRTLLVEVGDVQSISDYQTALLFIVQEGLYRISIDNIRYILSQVIGWENTDNLDKQHFSFLIQVNDPALLKRIRADFPTYVSDVLLKLEKNTDEDVATILEVLARKDVEQNLRSEFLKKQTVIFQNFDGISSDFHQIILEGRKIKATWENGLKFMTSDVYDVDLFTAYLQHSETAAALSQQQIPGDDASFPLRKFVIENDALSLEVYRSYIRQLPKLFNVFPELKTDKVKILIEESKITFDPSTFASLQDADLQVLFIARNFATYEVNKDSYSIDDNFRAKLLRTGIMDTQKLELISNMDEAYVVSVTAVAAEIGSLLDRHTIEKYDYGVAFIKAVILNSRSIKTQISLFNKLHTTLSVSEVREILCGLPGTFQDIVTFGKSPKIENNVENRELVVWLKQRDIISSYRDTYFGDEIKIHTFKKER